MNNTNTTNIICSFCKNSEIKYNFIIQSNNSKICNNCIKICNEYIEHNSQKYNIVPYKDVEPYKLFSQIRQHVIGQEFGLKTLCSAIFGHIYKQNNQVESKSNIIIIGPTGSGKTMSVNRISKIINVPFAVSDVTKITAAGYVGEDVDTVILQLIKKTNYNISKAERGIVFLDEIDKLAKTQDYGNHISGRAIQESFLTILEGNTITINERINNIVMKSYTINTSNILFIASGAFSDINKIIKNRINSNYSLLNNVKSINNNYKHIQIDDIQEYGLIPEFIARFPILVQYDQLKDNEIVKIIKQSHILKTFLNIFKEYNVNVTLNNNTILHIAHESLKLNIGARGIHTILEKIFSPFIFQLGQNNNIKVINLTVNTVSKILNNTFDKL